MEELTEGTASQLTNGSQGAAGKVVQKKESKNKYEGTSKKPNSALGILFGTIEKVKDEYCIKEYAITPTALEQIFNNFVTGRDDLLGADGPGASKSYNEKYEHSPLRLSAAKYQGDEEKDRKSKVTGLQKPLHKLDDGVDDEAKRNAEKNKNDLDDEKQSDEYEL